MGLKRRGKQAVLQLAVPVGVTTVSANFGQVFAKRHIVTCKVPAFTNSRNVRAIINAQTICVGNHTVSFQFGINLHE